jgi:hypothetical protein
MPKIIDYNELYYLHDPDATRPLLLNPIQDWISTRRAVELFTGEWQPPEPVTFKATRGRQATDILWSLIPIICVSQRIIDIFTENGFTGWGTYPAEVYDRDEKLLPGYYGLSVISYAGEQDFSRSRRIFKPPIIPSGKPLEVVKGMYFNEALWDDADIFRLKAAFIIVTRRVRDALKKAKIINVNFTPLTEVELNSYLADKK